MKAAWDLPLWLERKAAGARARLNGIQRLEVANLGDLAMDRLWSHCDFGVSSYLRLLDPQLSWEVVKGAAR
jgi:hypothetical protein